MCWIARWALEASFEKHVHSMMRAARKSNGVFLFSYFEKMYNKSVKEHCSMYVGVHELCHIVSEKPCEAGQHLTCLARKTVEAYNLIKVHARVKGSRRRRLL